MVVFDSWLYGMAFCPSVFKLSFGFWFFPYLGACLGEVDFDDLEANLIFAVLFLWRSISVTLRQIYFLQCSTL